MALADLEAWRAKGEDELLKELKNVTNRSVSALRKALSVELDALQKQRLLVACDSDRGLYDRVRPFAGIIRHDRADRPLVFRAGGLYVTAGSDRATTGAHYTPRSLTESIVQHALEPLVYDGPAEGKPREDWRLISPKALLELKVCDPAMGSGAFLVQACRFLSERLVEAWDQAEESMTDDNPVDSTGTDLVSGRSSGRRQPRPITIAPDGSLSRGRPSEQILPQDPAERLAIARRLVVDHCLYGVDVNPLAVDMAKLSLWLVTLQKDRPFTFIDHRLRCGDSLLGIGDIEQLRHWNLQGKPDGETWRQTSWFHQQMKQAIERAVELRRQIETMPELDVHDSERKADLLEQAEQTMGLVKLGADLLIGSALHPEKKRRDEVRNELQYRFSLQVDAVRQMVEGQLNDEGKRRVSAGLSELRSESQRMLGDKRPFHWPLEFPEVFLDAGSHTAPHGFSAIVGNPPFLGGTKISSNYGAYYRLYLADYIASTSSGGRGDLCAYFFIRSGTIVAKGGDIALLATNTIAQGDTREIGVDRLIATGFSIHRAIRSSKWPGQATLEVAHVWLHRGEWRGDFILDGESVSGITPFLTEIGRVTGPAQRLDANQGQIFVGSYLLGKGFVIEPDQAKLLIDSDNKNSDVISLYLSGDDLNSHPNQSASRWAINFLDWPIERAKSYPGPFTILESMVKEERLSKAKEVASHPWWQYWRARANLYRAILDRESVLVTTMHTKYITFSRVSASQVFSHALAVISLRDQRQECTLLSAFHEAWALLHGSSIGHMPRYTPTDCFETFPFPRERVLSIVLADQLLEHRSRSMSDRCLGLTDFLNLVHDLGEDADDVCHYRTLQQNLDLEAVMHLLNWRHGIFRTPHPVPVRRV